MFDELSEDELVRARAGVEAAGLAAARLTAASRFVAGPGCGLGEPAEVGELLMARDTSDERWERIGPYEQSWALLVVRIVGSAMDPVAAVVDARRRGCAWASVGVALGVSAQAVQQRFAGRVGRA